MDFYSKFTCFVAIRRIALSGPLLNWPPSSVADSHCFDADPAFHIDANPDPTTHFFQMLQNDPLRLPPFLFNADLDSDPAFHSDADPDPAFNFDPDPDPASRNYADPDTSH
jgi:hypothetical protein